MTPPISFAFCGTLNSKGNGVPEAMLATTGAAEDTTLVPNFKKSIFFSKALNFFLVSSAGIRSSSSRKRASIIADFASS